jgi:hypothetical protein
MHPSAPSTLRTPHGTAHIVIDSLAAGKPIYQVNGEPIDLDVTIPDDLAEHFYWFGPFLTRDTPPDKPGLSICANSYPPPRCFDIAREWLRREREPEVIPREDVLVDYDNPEPDYLFTEQLFRAILRADRMSEPSHQQLDEVPVNAPKRQVRRRAHPKILYPYVAWWENVQGKGYWRVWDSRSRKYKLFLDTEREQAIALAKELEPLRRKRKARV